MSMYITEPPVQEACKGKYNGVLTSDEVLTILDSFLLYSGFVEWIESPDCPDCKKPIKECSGCGRKFDYDVYGTFIHWWNDYLEDEIDEVEKHFFTKEKSDE